MSGSHIRSVEAGIVVLNYAWRAPGGGHPEDGPLGVSWSHQREGGEARETRPYPEKICISLFCFWFPCWFFFLSSVNSIIHIFSQYLLMPTLFDLIFKSLRLEIILNYSD